MKKSASLSVVILVLTAFYSVGYQAFGTTHEDCEEAETSAAMQTCASQRYEAANAELNRVYRRLTGELPEPRREQLKAAQQAWIAFRDKNAAFVAAAAEGGTMYQILEISELAAMTERRSEQLKVHLD